MTFTTNIFLIGLLPWFIFLVYLTRNIINARKLLIIVANTIFYIFGGIGSFLIVCVYTILIWIFAYIVRKNKNKILFIFFIIISAMPLLLVKYTGFVIQNINNIFCLSILIPSIIIPIGISFFSFEAISLLCDVYKGTVDEGITFFNVYSYITFFPTITSGPILRFNQFVKGFTTQINIVDYGDNQTLVGFPKV